MDDFKILRLEGKNIQRFITNFISEDSTNLKHQFQKSFPISSRIRVCWASAPSDYCRTSGAMKIISVVAEIQHQLGNPEQLHIIDYQNFSKIRASPHIGFGILMNQSKKLFFAHKDLSTFYISDELWKIFLHLFSPTQMLGFSIRLEEMRERKITCAVEYLKKHMPLALCFEIITYFKLIL